MAGGPPGVPWSLHAIIATIVDKLVWFCALLPYGVIALLVRIVMARVFFLAGQDKIRGPRIPLPAAREPSWIRSHPSRSDRHLACGDQRLDVAAIRNPIRLFPGAGRCRGLSRHLR